MKATTQLLVRFDPRLHKRLKRVALKMETSMQDAVAEAVTAWLREAEKPKSEHTEMGQ